ncbi:MAG: Cytochrome c oxidase assembly protein CtaG [Alphaproteobacteria bacterium MarineAlpha9_Bin7]|nr:MAG: Cytochrome c oxidase assembly protein CtaG [Alphaproteobacteria bacterium MarineAlpha9_Bin7]
MVRGRYSITGLSLAALVVGMVGLSYAAVPLYDLFCRATGYGGTTMVATEVPNQIGEREMTVRFNADVNRDLPWRFHPVKGSVTVRLGEPTLAFYRVENTSDRLMVGTAAYNVTPLTAGEYFSKIDCFCFTEQVLQPGEVAELPVSFFVDPSIADDPKMDRINTLTLSYTFFEVGNSKREQVSSADHVSNSTVK